MESKRIVSDKLYAYKAVALRHADKLEKRLNCKCNAMPKVDYYKSFGDLTRKVVNIMTGAIVEESINTPYSCSVSSESYWSN
jgi:hypothetical protein